MMTEQEVLQNNFTAYGGVIRPKKEGYVPSLEEYRCIVYLCEEWDYAYDSTKALGDKQ